MIPGRSRMAPSRLLAMSSARYRKPLPGLLPTAAAAAGSITLHGAYGDHNVDPVGSLTATGVAGVGGDIYVVVAVGAKGDFDNGNNVTFSNTMGLSGQPTKITNTTNGSANIGVWRWAGPGSSGNVTASLVTGTDEMALIVLDMDTPAVEVSSISPIDSTSPFRSATTHTTQASVSASTKSLGFATAQNAVISSIDNMTTIAEEGNLYDAGAAVGLLVASNTTDDLDTITCNLEDTLGAPKSEEGSVIHIRFVDE